MSTPVCTLHSQNSVHIRLNIQISQRGSILTEASNGLIYRLWVFIISGCIQGDTGVRHNLLRFLLYSMVDTLLKSFYYSIQHEFVLIKYFLLLTTSRVNLPLKLSSLWSIIHVSPTNETLARVLLWQFYEWLIFSINSCNEFPFVLMASLKKLLLWSTTC